MFVLVLIYYWLTKFFKSTPKQNTTKTLRQNTLSIFILLVEELFWVSPGAQGLGAGAAVSVDGVGVTSDPVLVPLKAF